MRLKDRTKPYAKRAGPRPSLPAMRPIKNRIVDSAIVDARTLKPHPMNARTHTDMQRKAMAGVLDRIGWTDEIIVNKRSGFILNGHLRVDIAAGKGESVPVSYVDLTEAEEKEVLLAFDPLGSMALVDEEQLASLLADVRLDDADLKAMLEGLLGEAGMETPKDVAAPPIPNGDRTPRQLGDRKAQIKPVLYAGQVHTFEEALRMTGEPNRGKALMEICQFYIDASGSEKG